MQQTEVDLAHAVHGDGFPLLLVHGFTGSSLDGTDAVLVVIPDTAHSPQDENRDAWLAAIEAHLARANTV